MSFVSTVASPQKRSPWVPAFNRVLGESLNQLAAKVAAKGEHHEQYASQPLNSHAPPHSCRRDRQSETRGHRHPGIRP